MSNLSDGRRTQRGTSSSHKRYIRRAKYLIRDDEFQWKSEFLRLLWNARFPEFKIQGATDVGEEWPLALERALNVHGLLVNPMAPEPPDGSPQSLSFHRARWAATAWVFIMDQQCTYFFPPENFPNPQPRLGHPARRFWYAALAGTQPSVLDHNIKNLIPEIVLQPDLNASSTEVLMAFANPELESAVIGMGMSLPLFPGMTREDVNEAAGSAVDKINEIYWDRTPWGRMQILRASSMSKRRIGTTLGIPFETVRDAFRKRRR